MKPQSPKPESSKDPLQQDTAQPMPNTGSHQLIDSHDVQNGQHKSTNRVSLLELGYDIFMLGIIIIDLLLIGMDLVFMSSFIQQIANWFGLSLHLSHYVTHWHEPVRFLGGVITLFLVVELSARWLIAIVTKRYLRWFFFPFVHWYEVLGCFPQLRALRLLRAIFIGKKLYQMGIQILPEKWIDAGRFYYALVLEELSDRVILTATDNLRQQFAGSDTKDKLFADTLGKNRQALQATIASMLKQELSPKLKQLAHEPIADELAHLVGASVQEALSNTPELRRYLRLVPIAGKMIESELHIIGSQVGENLVASLSTRLTETDFIEPLVLAISEAVVNINLDNPELEALVATIINDSLSAFDAQIKIQQWKHSEQLKIKP